MPDMTPILTRLLLCLALPLAAAGTASAQTEPAPERQAQLVHMVRQDCGSCHGMQLTGGLGPALTREALATKPADYVSAVILHGLPDTPMPPWSAMLNEDEAAWIARQLVGGFPLESRSSPQ
ncbi:hypothetical protein GCM10022279_22920 [Comamonas faecalis]|uniref:Cytochrome c domain-containing protein n=1 Tax=Comamonas faecalis TaxID=1387849 RepID=A0ABP7RK50_9BURK